MAENRNCREIVLAEFARIISEVVCSEFDIRAIGVVTVDKTGNVHTKYAFDTDGKFPLLSGMVCMQDDLIRRIKDEGKNNLVINMKG